VTTRLAPTKPPTPPTRVHLVYPHGNKASTPDSIGREVGRRLELRYQVIYHDWMDHAVVKPEPGDVLVGHPHPDPNTIFRRSVREDGWHRKLLLGPYHHGDLRQNAFVDSILRDCDLFLAITGPHWFRTIGDSPCSHWLPKMAHLDLAIDRKDFPPLKKSFGAPGKRRVLYIGHTSRGKNTSYLTEIAALLPEIEFGWIGKGVRPIHGFTTHGFVDYDSPSGKELLAGFDLFLTVGNADANPTTILEAMAWGLIPVCTPTSGYDGIPSVANVPLGDAAAAAAVVGGLLFADESDLLAMQAANWKSLDDHYNWDRFAGQVIEAIDSTASPALGPESPKRRLEFALYDLTSPYGPMAHRRAGKVVMNLRRRWKGMRAARAAQTSGRHIQR
jgi:glycosyltransferase involved in cell wall biosynthesis